MKFWHPHKGPQGGCLLAILLGFLALLAIAYLTGKHAG